MKLNVLKSIKKLFALAQSDNKNEAQQAQKKAEELCLKHNVNLQDLAAVTLDSNLSTEATLNIDIRAYWKSALAQAIKYYTNVGLVSSHDSKRLYVFGTTLDIETFQSLFSRAQSEIDKEANIQGAFFKHNPKLIQELGAASSAKERNDSFRKGAANGFKERLEEWSQKAHDNNPNKSTLRTWNPGERGEIVLVSRVLAIKANIEKMFPTLKTRHITTTKFNGDYERGHAFGKRMGVHKDFLE